MQNTPQKPRKYTGVKYLLGSLVLAAALWFWGLFSGKALDNLKNVAATTDTQPDPIQPLIVSQPTQAAPAATLPSINIPLNNQANHQPVIQTVIIPGGNLPASSAPGPLTSTSSSH